MTDRDTQLQYELESDSAAQVSRLQELIAASKKGDLALPRAHALVGQMCQAVQAKIEEYAAVKTQGMGGKYKTWIRTLPSDVAAVIAIRECIRLCTGYDKYVHVQDLTFNVGKLWELEVRIRQAQEVNAPYMRKVEEQLKDHATRDLGHIRRLYNVAITRVFKGSLDLELTKTDMMHIGKFGVDACYESGLIEQVRGVNKNGTTVSYVINPEVLDFLQGYDKDDVRKIISKEETRMVCPPDSWSNLTDGGYLSFRRKLAAPLMNVLKMRKSVRSKIAEEFTAEKMPQVFSAGNYLQSVPYRFHTATRDAILRVWQTGGGVLGVPPKEPPKKPEFPFNEDWLKESGTDDEMVQFNLWKRAAAKHYDDLRDWRAKVREIGSFLRSVRDLPGPYWFPVYCDSRGRWYYRGLPNPQGSDMAKAVLHFDQRKPLGRDGLYWLKVHIANSFGYDKVRLHDRAAWTDQNWSAIERAIDAPEDFPEVWGTDAPWCMYAACYELREAYRSGRPEGYHAGIPIPVDATCSGLQHFSALLLDPVGAEYVNLTDSDGSADKQDIYTRAAQAATTLVQADSLSADAELANLATWALAVGIPRELAKKPVMTYVYGATLRGTAEHVEEVLSKSLLPGKGMQWLDDSKRFEHCTYIAKKLFAGIEQAVPAAAQAMRWLRGIAKSQPNGKRMSWRTPTGFWVQHDYQDYTDKSVRLNSCGVVQVWVREWAEGTRSTAMQNAISPNFVHALDASHLTMVVNKMADNRLDLVAVHDSFGTHACDVAEMQSIIRQEFVNLYSQSNLLEEFLWEVEAEAEIPKRGDFNLHQVISSEFMFS
jgi:DNA-directed RNA polymerase